MALGSQPRWNVRTAGSLQADVDAGLRNYMLRIYNYMASGLALTGIVALVAYNSGFYLSIARTPLIWLVLLAPLGFVMWLAWGIDRMQARTAQTLFWLVAGCTGISLAGWFYLYTPVSIARVFFITAGTFAGMSLYGYTTQRDLTAWGSFLRMGLWGLIIAMAVNYFLPAETQAMLTFLISVVGVIVFTGLTAYDTQRLKEEYYAYQYADGQTATKSAVMGALSLYLDFYNLFLFLLQLLGARRD